jgi:hypothetical protein
MDKQPCQNKYLTEGEEKRMNQPVQVVVQVVVVEELRLREIIREELAKFLGEREADTAPTTTTIKELRLKSGLSTLPGPIVRVEPSAAAKTHMEVINHDSDSITESHR